MIWFYRAINAANLFLLFNELQITFDEQNQEK
jgi:hypothetical protein